MARLYARVLRVERSIVSVHAMIVMKSAPFVDLTQVLPVNIVMTEELDRGLLGFGQLLGICFSGIIAGELKDLDLDFIGS